jgi:hypothetical protein
MDDQRTSREGGEGVIPRFRLRVLLLMFVPISIVLALFGNAEIQREHAIKAWDRMGKLGMDASVLKQGFTVYFKSRNVTDDDLMAFIPAWNGFAPSGFHEIAQVNLCGSNVSDDAVAKFRNSVPSCDLIR